MRLTEGGARYMDPRDTQSFTKNIINKPSVARLVSVILLFLNSSQGMGGPCLERGRNR